MDNQALIPNNLKPFQIKKMNDTYGKKTFINEDTNNKMALAGLNVNLIQDFLKRYELATASKDLCFQTIVLGVFFIFCIVFVPLIMFIYSNTLDLYFSEGNFYVSLYFFFAADILFSLFFLLVAFQTILRANKEIKKRGEILIEEENKKHSNIIISSSCCYKLVISPKVLNFIPYNNLDTNNVTENIDINNFTEQGIINNRNLEIQSQSTKIIRIPANISKMNPDYMKPETYLNITLEERQVYDQINQFKLTTYQVYRPNMFRYVFITFGIIFTGWLLPLLLSAFNICFSFHLNFAYYTFVTIGLCGYLMWEMEFFNKIVSQELNKFNKSRVLSNWIVEFRPEASCFFAYYVNEENKTLITSHLLNLLI